MSTNVIILLPIAGSKEVYWKITCQRDFFSTRGVKLILCRLCLDINRNAISYYRLDVKDEEGNH